MQVRQGNKNFKSKSNNFLIFRNNWLNTELLETFCLILLKYEVSKLNNNYFT